MREHMRCRNSFHITNTCWSPEHKTMLALNNLWVIQICKYYLIVNHDDKWQNSVRI